jgi:uncharacterized protein DUF5957
MRTAGQVVLGLVAGFFAGLVISEIIGIVGVLAFDHAVGFRYLPLATGWRERSSPPSSSGATPSCQHRRPAGSSPCRQVE